MALPPAGEFAPILDRMMRRPGARWAEVFLERRSVESVECRTEGPPVRRLAFDEGATVRTVLSSGASRQAAVSGDPGPAAEEAARHLTADSGCEPFREAGRSADPGEPEAATDDTRLSAWMHRIVSSAGVTLRAVVTRQEIAHVSSDSGPVEDVRQGVVVEARFSGRDLGRPLPVRRLAGRDPADLEARHPPEALAAELKESLRLAADRVPAPDGERTVVLAPGSPGIFLHEAVGHLLEGEATGTGRLRPEDLPRVSPLLNVMDDPSAVRGNGSYRVDDEGVEARRVILMEAGRFRAPVADRWSAPLTLTSTGHGRRQSFRDSPLPRLAATVARAGEDDPEEIVRATSNGIFVQEIGRGRCDPSSGLVIVHVTRARRIDQGRLSSPLHEFLLIGESRDALSSVDRTGFDARDDGGAHACVRGGQAVPVIVGLPTLRMARLKVRSLAIA